MPRWPWLEHTFSFDYPAIKFPEILERLRGTPARVTTRIAGLAPDQLVRRVDEGWSVQQNIGHLVDVHILMFIRLDELLSGAEVLTSPHAVKLSAPLPDHDARSISAVLGDLQTQRSEFVARLESCCEDDWSRTALHTRLNKPMRLVDHALFFAEHDDYHLARISELVCVITPAPG